MVQQGDGSFLVAAKIVEDRILLHDTATNSPVALTRTELLVITQGGLLIRLRRDPTFAIEMLHKLSGRVRALNQQVERDRPS